MAENDVGSLIGATLNHVYATHFDEEFPGTFSEIELHLDGRLLRLLAMPDTDEIEVEIVPADTVQRPAPLDDQGWMNQLTGLRLQSVWICTNNQGYQDLVVLAFEYLTPNIAFVCEASAIKVLRMAKR